MVVLRLAPSNLARALPAQRRATRRSAPGADPPQRPLRSPIRWRLGDGRRWLFLSGGALG